MTTPTGPIGSLSELGKTPAPSAATSRPDQFGKDTFLKLLVAQLKYQDPTKPTDSSQFMAQTAQFTVVEKLEALSKQSGELLASERIVAASSMIGRQVSATGPDGADLVGVVTGTRLDPSGPVLLVGGKEVPLSAVKEVRQPAT